MALETLSPGVHFIPLFPWYLSFLFSPLHQGTTPAIIHCENSLTNGHSIVNFYFPSGRVHKGRCFFIMSAAFMGKACFSRTSYQSPLASFPVHFVFSFKEHEHAHSSRQKYDLFNYPQCEPHCVVLFIVRPRGIHTVQCLRSTGADKMR